MGSETFKRISMRKHVRMKETFLTSYMGCTKIPKTKDVSTGDTLNNTPMLKGNLGKEGWCSGENTRFPPAKQWNALPDFFRTSFFADFKTKIQDVTFM